MRNDGRDDGRELPRKLEMTTREVEDRGVSENAEHHLVFDFTDLNTANFADLALILTARLQTPAGDAVWVRGIQPRTERVLRALGLTHLFRSYPGTDIVH